MICMGRVTVRWHAAKHVFVRAPPHPFVWARTQMPPSEDVDEFNRSMTGSFEAVGQVSHLWETTPTLKLAKITTGGPPSMLTTSMCGVCR